MFKFSRFLCMIAFICSNFLIFSTYLNAYEHELAICAIFQNEARFLKEWIEFHKIAGVQHFYLYNNLSSDNYEEILKPYLKNGMVDLIEWPHHSDNVVEWNAIQCNAYNDCLSRTKKKSQWVAFIDTDEFIIPVKKENLRKILKKYKENCALSINWQMYGTNNIWDCQGHLLEKMLYKAPTQSQVNYHVKTIVKPAYAHNFVNPHYPNLINGLLQVNENKISFTGPFSPEISIKTIRINHYWSRDDKFMHEIKIPRRAKWGNQDTDILKTNQEFNQEYDDIIFKYRSRLTFMMMRP